MTAPWKACTECSPDNRCQGVVNVPGFDFPSSPERLYTDVLPIPPTATELLLVVAAPHNSRGAWCSASFQWTQDKFNFVGDFSASVHAGVTWISRKTGGFRHVRLTFESRTGEARVSSASLHALQVREPAQPEDPDREDPS